jgi:putative ABC transport system permease protein
MSKKPQESPAFLRGILLFLLRNSVREGAVEDFEERFSFLIEQKNWCFATLWYLFQLCFLIPSFLRDLFYWSVVMFKNYLKIAFRNIRRHLGYSVINVTGLTVGMACCLLILLWVQDEVSFDRFHENLDDLHVAVTSARFGDEVLTFPGTPPAFAPAVIEEYPEIVNAARFNNGTTSLVLTYGEKTFREEVQLADASALEMFTFPLIQGDPASALSETHSIVMTEGMAEKYFGEEDPVGKIIRVNDTYDFTVSGVLKDISPNSSIQFDFLAPVEFLNDIRGRSYLTTWGNLSFRTYVQLQSNVSFESVSQKLANRLIREGQEDVEVFLRPFKRLHLFWLDQGGGQIDQVRTFSLIAFFVLFIACINFMNLTTARSENRAREIGIRKVVGAHRRNIIEQFYGESVLLAFLSLVFAVLLVRLGLPAFNTLVGKEISFNFFQNPVFFLGLLGITVVTALLSGSYPAIFMSSFQPVKTLKGALRSGYKGSHFRKVLVVVQFAISIALIIASVVVYKQILFIRNKDLGFVKEQLLYVPIRGYFPDGSAAIKQELLQYPDILSVSVTSHLPTGIYWNGSGWDWEGRNPNVDPLVTYLAADPDFLETFKIEMAQGKFYPKGALADDSGYTSSIVINEEFGRMIGRGSLIGQRLTVGTENLTIIGVIEDFHFKPMQAEVGPLVIILPAPYRSQFMFMRIDSNAIPETLERIEGTLKKVRSDFPFEYHFLDEDFDRLYRAEQRTGAIIRYFSCLTILISCLGLLGLASFTAEQRTKEIGIRRVLGSSMKSIVLLLSRDFLKWVAAANILAWPIAYFYTHKWLQNYAYRTNVGWDLFVFAGFFAIFIALVTVSYQAIRAARTNPVDALRNE